MRKTILFAACAALTAAFAAEDYKLGPDSEEQAGVPKGTVTEYKFTESKIYPGTVRSYWIYLPPEFNAQTEYPLMVFFDGGGCIGAKGQFRVPIVFDNLIHKKEIPPLVGLFINPGDVPPVAKGARGRSTRSFEYDTPDGACAEFVIGEMLPLAAQKAKLSAKPDDHALWGISSGGIAAFNAAWQRPDYFRKVVSFIGSFTNIRGGYWFPSAIRKTERKPIRVFLQDGSNDLDNVHGNWPLGAQEMAAALKFAGYDYKFTFGDGGHSGKQGGAILPDVLRWLWRPAEPLPKPTAEAAGDMALSGILIPGEEWQMVVEGKKIPTAACTDADGNFYFADSGADGIFKISVDGVTTPFNTTATGVSGLNFGPDGRLYACSKGHLLVYASNGKEEILARDVKSFDLVVTHRGDVYFTTGLREVMLWQGPDKLRAVDVGVHLGIAFPCGIALSPNQETLAVADYFKSAIWTFRVEANGSLGGKMPIMPYRPKEFDRKAVPGGGCVVCDTRARFYCGTSEGIETFDPNGRPIGLILPPGKEPVTSIALSGPELSWLFALSGGKVYKRKVNAKGFVTYLPPILK
ncbi:MAG TPA: alpha/beta hydrolase-fold protein [Planctomycetota bacterium]|nr:alpha/beta hydrolase-fold protein [Planctomycetota bacterium]